MLELLPNFHCHLQWRRPEKMIRCFRSGAERVWYPTFSFRPDRLQHPLVHRGARGVGTSGARHVHYLGLVQTSQGLQEVAEVAADAVEVLKWSNGTWGEI